MIGYDEDGPYSDDPYGDAAEAERLAEEERDDVCPKCGEVVPIGGWAFCASPRNPGGHTKGGAYVWSMKFPMKTQGWTRREQ